MKNNKGQALIEFIFIVPIIIFIIFAMIDFSNIIYQKYQLENNIDTIAEMYEQKKQDQIDSYLSQIDSKVEYQKEDGYTKIILEKEVPVNTIILNNIIGKKYKITTNKVISTGDENE